MAKVDYKILIIGDVESVYIVNFVKYLKLENSHVHIDVLCTNKNSDINECGIEDYIDNHFLFDIDKSYLDSIPLIGSLGIIVKKRRLFKKIIAINKYDVINIHYVKGQYAYFLDLFKKSSGNIVLSPWGSDVYRVGRKEKKLLKYLYKEANYISGVNNRFTKDVMEMFEIPAHKVVNFDLGSEAIDYIEENKNKINVEEAKRAIGAEGKYVITCGYNASPAQRHIQIVEAVNRIKNQLPSNLVLVFPFTYSGSEEYKREIKELVRKLKIEALYFEQFLELKDLFYLRQSTDIFIHVQTTDANSTSIGEYLLLGKKVINGEWVRYAELERSGLIPYFIAHSIDDLDKVILNTYEADKIHFNDDVNDVLHMKSCKTNAKKANDAFISILKKNK